MRLAYAAAQLALSRQAWRTPEVHPFRAWLEREAFRAADSPGSVPRPLRPVEEWLLWREAAQEATRDRDWSAGDHLSESLRRAARLMADWHIPRAALDSAGTAEGDVLARALAHVEARCRAIRAAASHELGAALRSLSPAQPGAFAGFLEHTPARRALAERWSARAPQHSQASALAEHPGDTLDGRVQLCRAGDASEELELAAEWCRAMLAANPRAHLLVVVPSPTRVRAEAQRTLAHALEPQGALGVREMSLLAPALAVEGGAPLARYPLVRHALTTLKFLTGALEFEALSAWLRATFWDAPPQTERARLDEWLRRVLRVEVTPLELSAALASAPGALGIGGRALASALRAAARALGSPEEHAAPVQWAGRFEEALRAAGWPGARPLSSAELQTRIRFAELLADFVSLGAHLGSVSRHRAVDVLEALTARTRFAPATGEAAVTLTSALEDPIVRYDGIWVAGLHADAWPPPPSVDPFVPLAAQRRARIPWATSLGMAERAQELLARWRRTTPELILSWSAWGEERGYLASPLVAELPVAEEPPRALQHIPSLAQSIRRARRVETFEDQVGQPWPARLPLPGGVRALEQQGRCPFRAYAELRLGCAPLETPRPGIDPRERGRFLHRAAELLWQRLGDSAGLEGAHRGGALNGLIEVCVAQAAEERRTAPAASADLVLRAAWRRERHRAGRLLAQLTALELQRAPFRVLALELSRRLELGGAVLDLRIDRIDELEDGARAIFDYKTGRPAAPDLLAERPSDPQLPAYLLAGGEGVVALATVSLSEELVAYRGLADRAGRLPNLEPLGGWQAQEARWRLALERLTREFLAGAAAVDPVEEACRRCHLHAFCRIAEVGTSRNGPDDRRP